MSHTVGFQPYVRKHMIHLCFHFLSILQESYCTPILFSSFQCPSSGSEVQYAQSYTSMYSLFFCRFREFCTYSMHTVLPVLPPTLTKHTHAGRYSWNRKSVVHQCRIRFHGIPLIPLARVFSQCVSSVSYTHLTLPTTSRV